MESRVEKIRKYCVIGFIVVGLACIFVEKSQGPKKYIGTDSEVRVEILAKKNGKGELRITDIICTHGDTEAIAGPAVESLITTIKSTQDIESLDTVAGATYTSEGFIDAMKDACSKVK